MTISSTSLPILSIRGKPVIIDTDLAKLYGVETRALNQGVKRNFERFPEDFCFQLTKDEKQELITICDHLQNLKFSKTFPYAFTEHGALMAANVLSSPSEDLRSQISDFKSHILYPTLPI